MNYKVVMLIAAVVYMTTGCKKETSLKTPQISDIPSTGFSSIPKTKIYRVNKMVIKYLDSPLPSSEAHTFKYDTLSQLIQHTVVTNNANNNYSTKYKLIYNNGKVVEVDKTGGKYYHWNNIYYTYADSTIKEVYNYPDKKDSVRIVFNKRSLPRRITGAYEFYRLTFDKTGNIISRGEYEKSDPTKVTFQQNYTYDNRPSPFSSQRDNTYIAFEAFNDISTNYNNRLKNNLEIYGLTYNADGYPTKINYIHGPVVVRTVEFTYTVMLK